MWHVRSRATADFGGIGAVLENVYAADGYPVEGPAATMRTVQSESPAGAWVAEIDTEIVGHVVLFAPPENPLPGQHAAGLEGPSGTSSAPATLARLAVRTDVRGQGIATALIDAVLGEAQRHDWSLVLDVLAKDEAAIRLYERTGWVRFAEFEHQVDSRCYPGYAYRYQPD